MPSYLEKEQIQSIQPVIANGSAILNTFQTKLNYWGAGAAQLKSAYQRYLGMDLTREDNQGKLKDFMSQAKGQLQKAAQTDLSIGDNQTEALNIFDPLVNGKTEFSKEILADNSITNHYQDQLSTAESFRTRDGGKEYSETNVQYLLNHLNDYKNDASASNYSQYLGQKRYYSPYHDYHKEVKDIMATYKPNSVSKSRPTNGMYFHSIEDKSTTKEDAQRYIEANLSDKARNQMRIESSVSWHGRENDLLKSVKADWDSENVRYKSYSESLEAQIRIASDPVVKANLEKEKSLVDSRRGDISTNIKKYENGDYREILSNKDAYANSIYTRNLMDGIATGYVRTDNTDKFAVDQAAVQTMMETGRNARFVSQLNYDKERDIADRATSLEIAQMRSDGSKKDQPGSSTFSLPKPGDSQGFIPVTDKDKSDLELSSSSLNKDLTDANTTQQQILDEMHNKLVNEEKITKQDDPSLRQKVMAEYIDKIDKRYAELAEKYKGMQYGDITANALMESEFFPGVMNTYNALKKTNQEIYAIKKVKQELVDRSMNDIRGLAKTNKTTIEYTNTKSGENGKLYIDPSVISKFVIDGDRSIIEEKEIQPPSVTRTNEMGMSYTISMPKTKAYFYKGRQLNTQAFENLKSSVTTAIDRTYGKDNATVKAIWKIGPNSKIKTETANSEIMANVTYKGVELKPNSYQVIGYGEDGMIYFKSAQDVEGATYSGKKDTDGRTVYGIKSQNFEVNTEIPANAKGVKYYVDRMTPFLKAGESKATPMDPNFFKIGNTSFQVVFQRSADMLTTSYELRKMIDNKNSRSIGTYSDIYSLFSDANIKGSGIFSK